MITGTGTAVRSDTAAMKCTVMHEVALIMCHNDGGDALAARTPSVRVRTAGNAVFVALVYGFSHCTLCISIRFVTILITAIADSLIRVHPRIKARTALPSWRLPARVRIKYLNCAATAAGEVRSLLARIVVFDLLHATAHVRGMACRKMIEPAAMCVALPALPQVRTRSATMAHVPGHGTRTPRGAFATFLITWIPGGPVRHSTVDRALVSIAVLCFAPLECTACLTTTPCG